MAEVTSVIRRDIANRDVAGQTYIVAGKLIIDGPNTRILGSDGSNNRILIDGDDGVIKASRAGFNVLTATNAQLAFSSGFAVPKEIWLPMHPQWTDSWTQNDSYTDVEGSTNSINFTDFPDHTWYFEMLGKTDDGTGSYQLYNSTAAAAVASSEITTTSTTIVRLRSGSLTKPSGTNTIKIQHKQTGGGGAGFVNSVMSRSVFRID